MCVLSGFLYLRTIYISSIISCKIYDELLQWKKGNGRRAVLVEVARRIGKSTVTTEFAKNEYKSFILINFAKKNTAVRRLFDDYMDDLDTFFMYLASAFNTKLYERNSVIILDEVQEFPRARECVKFLVEDGRYDYIEPGHLFQ